jgi:hypothetical protein
LTFWPPGRIVAPTARTVLANPFRAAKPDIFLATPPRFPFEEIGVLDTPRSFDEERLLWEQEMARSTRDYERAVRAGVVPARECAESKGRPVYEAVRARSRALIAQSRALCEESRLLCERSRRMRLQERPSRP